LAKTAEKDYRNMDFGIALPTYPAGATIEGVVKVAQAAERLGFKSAWTTDHVIMPGDQAGPYREIFEPLMILGYLAALTETVELGISVIVVPQRNGIVLAKQLATLDHLCQGRLIVGVGAGWNEREFAMLDAADRFHRRGAYLDETIHVWRHLWTTPQQPFEGEFYHLSDVAFGPAPFTAGGPAVWVGGSSLAARRRAGRLGSAWHPVGVSAVDLAEQFVAVREAAEAAGQPIPAAVARLPMRFSVGGGSMNANRNIQVLEGEPAQIAERLMEYRAAGAAEIICHFGSPDGDEVVESMEIFSREVMPIFNS
jgi:probable F420-dependent oxidoreductase